MNPVNHFVLIDAEQKGPLSIGQLRSLWNSGSVTAETQHFMDGYTDWLPLEFIREDLEEPRGSRSSAEVQPYVLPLPSRHRTPPPKARFPKRLLIVPGLLLLGLFVYLSPQPADTRFPAAELSSLQADLLPQGLLVSRTGDNSVRVTLPTDQSLFVSERMATEMALRVRERLGGNVTVRVKTPGGQTLGSAP